MIQGLTLKYPKDIPKITLEAEGRGLINSDATVDFYRVTSQNRWTKEKGILILVKFCGRSLSNVQ